MISFHWWIFLVQTIVCRRKCPWDFKVLLNEVSFSCFFQSDATCTSIQVIVKVFCFVAAGLTQKTKQFVTWRNLQNVFWVLLWRAYRQESQRFSCTEVVIYEVEEGVMEGNEEFGRKSHKTNHDSLMVHRRVPLFFPGFFKSLQLIESDHRAPCARVYFLDLSQPCKMQVQKHFVKVIVNNKL